MATVAMRAGATASAPASRESRHIDDARHGGGGGGGSEARSSTQEGLPARGQRASRQEHEALLAQRAPRFAGVVDTSPHPGSGGGGTVGTTAGKSPFGACSTRPATSKAWDSPARHAANLLKHGASVSSGEASAPSVDSWSARGVGHGTHPVAHAHAVLVEELGSPTLDGRDSPAPVEDLGLDDVRDVSWSDVFGDEQEVPSSGAAAPDVSSTSADSGGSRGFHGSPGAGSAATPTPHDARWRTAQQRLTVSLLAQLCANQDSTPRLFIDTCVRLFKAGLLDSLDFLSDILARTHARGHNGELGPSASAAGPERPPPPLVGDTRSLVRHAITGGPASASVLFPSHARLPRRAPPPLLLAVNVRDPAVPGSVGWRLAY